MLEELDAKGSEGYRLVSVIVNPKLDAPLIAFMEKTSTSKPKK